ncbi:DUF6207 family protein [Streptomyces sp. NPDC017083]|uniref:DUF6207 family protein n=1 Tax=unclassified Streptomyces TaxID=2593676 RepID=UPI0037A41656
MWTSRPRTTPPFLALQGALAERWATATDDQTTRTPGEPGVRLRCYLEAGSLPDKGRIIGCCG